MISHNTYPGVAVSSLEAAEQALMEPSTIPVRWTGGDFPTTTALVSEPGARISAEVFGGFPLIITDEAGNQSVTDFSVAVNLPPYNGATGKFGQGDERVVAYDVHRNPAVGQDIVVGEPIWGTGPRVVRVTVSGDAFPEVRGLDQETLRRLEQPAQEFNLPDPTFDAAHFLDRAHKKFDARHPARHV